MNRLWRLLHHLFGDDPPPRPSGHGHPHGHRRGHRHAHGEEEGREAEEQVLDGADDGPAPTVHHGH